MADTTQSTNWAGYAVHGATFRSVEGSWVQPSVSCIPGQQTYSSYWVGLGGYSQTAQALEQIGTEVDCTASGQPSSSAWYELVPAPSIPLRFTVQPGDLMQASVSVSASAVTVVLNDTTRKRVFRKTLRASVLDVSSAEWILEAPSECISADACQTLPLADFGSATFGAGSAQATSGGSGSISDPAWQLTKIKLRPDSRRFVVFNGSIPSIGFATPTPLTVGGTAFKVTYSSAPVSAARAHLASDASLRTGYLVHPGR